MKTQFVICETIEDVTSQASALIQQIIGQAIKDRGHASLAVSGGLTPQALFKRWQLETFPDLSSVSVFMSDERMVPTQSQDSNHGTMLRLWPDVCQSNLHLPEVNVAGVDVATDYESQVIQTLGITEIGRAHV